MIPPLRRFATLALAATFLLTGMAAARSAPQDPAPGGTSDTSAPGSEAVVVSAQAPTFTIPEEGFFTIPEAEGVEYVMAHSPYPEWVLEPRLHRLGYGYTTITAHALPGFVLEAPASWRYVYANALAPTFGDTFGTNEDWLEIPSIYGGPLFDYWVNGVETPWGQYPASGTVTVEARPVLSGYEMIGPFSWTYTYTDWKIVSVRTEPTFDVARSTYTITAQHGVQFLVNGSPKVAGTYRASGPVAIKAEGLPSYLLTGSSSWDHDFTPPFVDVRVGTEHYEHMVWMAETGISLGWGTPQGLEYRPLTPVGRDAMAAFLYRMAGSPKVTLPAQSPFTDITKGDPHYKAVVWAYQQDITTGWVMKDGTRQFRPTDPIARDAMAAFLYRFAEEPSFSMAAGSCFTDVSHTQAFAKEMCWMRSTGISRGWADGTYRPLQSVERDATAAFLYRYDKTF